MPRNVRNFWLCLEVDGRKSMIKTGPVRRDGGFQLSIYIREEGCISDKRLDVSGFHHEGNNLLRANLVDPNGLSQRMELAVPRNEKKKPEPVVEPPKEPKPIIKRDDAFWQLQEVTE